MSKGSRYDVGDRVEWDWGNGTADGEITAVYTQKRTLTIDGNDVTREASSDCPSYRIDTGDSEAFKSHSEVREADHG
jgi:hypothetical protein